jgi:monothiol glutaredoxin
VKGEFLGGSDIMMEMYDAGELKELVDTHGLAKAD